MSEISEWLKVMLEEIDRKREETAAESGAAQGEEPDGGARQPNDS